MTTWMPTKNDGNPCKLKVILPSRIQAWGPKFEIFWRIFQEIRKKLPKPAELWTISCRASHAARTVSSGRSDYPIEPLSKLVLISRARGTMGKSDYTMVNNGNKQCDTWWYFGVSDDGVYPRFMTMLGTMTVMSNHGSLRCPIFRQTQHWPILNSQITSSHSPTFISIC